MGAQELEGVSPGDRWGMCLRIKTIDKLMSKPTRNTAETCVELSGLCKQRWFAGFSFFIIFIFE